MWQSWRFEQNILDSRDDIFVSVLPGYGSLDVGTMEEGS